MVDAAASKEKKDRLKRLEDLQRQTAAQIAQIKATQEKKRRADDTRRKVLIGAFFMDSLQKTGKHPKDLKVGEMSFDEWLIRKADRELFSLPTEKSKTGARVTGQSGPEEAQATDAGTPQTETQR
jgi:hypothetical protein